ncbi:MAG: SRPBCC family protein [Jatrophihabitans sp.]
MSDTVKSLTRVSLVIEASAKRVFAELSDGWAYVGWVVGASHISGVDASWPAVGSKIQHQVGIWPMVISDDTESKACEPDELLLLQASAWPLGQATVEIRLEAQSADRTRVTIGEAPSAGPGVWLDNRVLRWALKRRNVETLQRLKDRAENRTMPR